MRNNLKQVHRQIEMTADTALHQQFCMQRSEKYFIKYEVLIVDHFSVLTDPFGSAHGKFRLDMVVMMTYDRLARTHGYESSVIALQTVFFLHFFFSFL